MYRVHTHWVKLSLGLLISALLLVIGGCSVGTGTAATGGRSNTPAQPTPTLKVSSPVPLISDPTATPAPSSTVPAYLLPNAPLLPAGWTWYRDSTGHFEVPLAPGWRAGSYFYTDGVRNCAYGVQFFPPGAGGSAGSAQATFAPRLIEIDLNVSCTSSWSINPEPYIVREPNPVIVDGQPVIVWDNVAATPEVHEFAYATFQGHQFAFVVNCQDSNFIVTDPKVFHQMLHGFEY